MSRFALFKGGRYYPSGGWQDFTASYANLELAKAAAKLDSYEWAHVVDMETWKIVWNSKDD